MQNEKLQILVVRLTLNFKFFIFNFALPTVFITELFRL